jgi:hypothetical protein
MEPGLCSRCRGFDAEELPFACTVLGGSPCSPCKEGEDILGQIKRLEDEILKLKKKHHALRTKINSTHDPFIHTFPPEIGSYIFRLCLPTLDFGQLSTFPRRKEVIGALRLGAVCRKWRQLAWTTPNLWEMLYLNIGRTTTNSLAKLLPGLVEAWLGRSGVLPLAIFFVHDYSGRSEIEFAIPRIIEVINLHSGRWRNLFLNVGADIPELFSGSAHPNQLGHLQLAINRRRSRTQKFIMESKPSPTHLQLRNFPPTSIDIGWDNLTHATLYSLSANECFEVLRLAPSLEYYHASRLIRVEPSGGPTVNLDTTITLLPRLRILVTPHEATKFLDAIVVPALEEWTHDGDSDPSLVTTMVSLLKRSGCCLKVLDFTGASDDLPILLQAIPSLERLQLKYQLSDVLHDIFDRIFRSPVDGSIIPLGDTGREPFLPRLQFMEYETPFSWDRVPQLYRQGDRHSLTLKFPTDMLETSDETAMELLKLVDEGAKFQIVDTFHGGDFLENFRNKMGRESR